MHFIYSPERPWPGYIMPADRVTIRNDPLAVSTRFRKQRAKPIDLNQWSWGTHLGDARCTMSRTMDDAQKEKATMQS